MKLYVGQTVNWKRGRRGTGVVGLCIRRVPATILKIMTERVQIELGEPVAGVESTPWVSRGSLERRPVISPVNSQEK